MATPDIYKKIYESKASVGGTPIKDGSYLLIVNKLMLEPKHSGLMFIAEFVVEESAPVDVDDRFRLPAEIGRPIEPNKPGTEVSFVINLTKNNESGPGNVKAFVLALDGSHEDEISEEEFVNKLKAATGPDQPLRGAQIRDTTWRKLIQKGANAGKPFTAHRWSYVEQSLEQIAAVRAKLDERGKAK
jgi:hypothetical protein